MSLFDVIQPADVFTEEKPVPVLKKEEKSSSKTMKYQPACTNITAIDTGIDIAVSVGVINRKSGQ